MFINHCHIIPEGLLDQNDPQKGTLKRLKEIMDKTGVTKAIAFAPFVRLMPWDESWYKIDFKTERECNEWFYQSLKDYQRIYGFVTVNPKSPDSCEILTEYINKGFVGAKIHPPVFQIKIDDPSLDKFYSTSEKLNIPLLFHTGVHGWKLDQYMPILLDNVAQKHPDLKIIIAHMGGVAFFDQALAVLHNNKNCYAGITQCSGRDWKSIMPPERVKLILDIPGAENRIIYGLDYPFNPDNLQALSDDIKWIQSLNISKEEQEKILGKNLEKLIER